MKILVSLLAAAAVAASFLASRIKAGDAEALGAEAAYEVQVEHQTVAFLPANPLEITASKVTREGENTQLLEGAKIIIKVPGQAPVTLTADKLTLIQRK